jgi:subtilisin family serine protease
VLSNLKWGSASLVAAVILGQVLFPSVGRAQEKFFPAATNGVPRSYGIVLSAASTASAEAKLAGSVGGRLGYIYRYVLNGFQAELSEYQAELLSRDPSVKSVVQETYLNDPVSYTLPHCYEDFDTNTRSLPPLPGAGDPVPQQILDCDDPAPGGDCIDNWGVDRIDQYGLPRDEAFSYRQAAGNVKVFVIDTGVAWSNREFDDASGVTRVVSGIDADCDTFPFCPPGNVPCSGSWPGNGHGTHVAAILGGRTFGLARDVEIYPVKALCSTYSTAEFKKALDFIVSLHPSTAPTAVVNLSGLNALSSCYYDPTCPEGDQLREALINLVRRNNILFVQSAGNQSGSDACDHTWGDESRYSDPNDSAAIARIVVAAGSDENDGRWRTEPGDYGHPLGSTIGGCVDVFAPAAHIASAFLPFDPDPFDPDEAVCQLSGTSMAAPHVSGIAAMILQNWPTMRSEALRTVILNWAEPDVLEANPGDPNYIGDGSPNLLLHWDPNIILRDGFETGDLRVWLVSS